MKNNKKCHVVDIDAILNRVCRSRNLTDIEKNMAKSLKDCNGDKGSVVFALDVGVDQGMPLCYYVACMSYLGFNEKECFDHLLDFQQHVVKQHASSRSEANTLMANIIECESNR